MALDMSMRGRARQQSEALNPAAATAVIATMVGLAWACIGAFVYLIVL